MKMNATFVKSLRRMNYGFVVANKYAYRKQMLVAVGTKNKILICECYDI